MTTLEEWLKANNNKTCWHCGKPIKLSDEIEFDYQNIMYHKGCKERHRIERLVHGAMSTRP